MSKSYKRDMQKFRKKEREKRQKRMNRKFLWQALGRGRMAQCLKRGLKFHAREDVLSILLKKLLIPIRSERLGAA